MALKLRKPQLEALVETKAAWEDGLRRLLIVLPTGMGKTPTFANIRKFFGFKKGCLILVHMEELATQARDKVQVWNPEETVGVEMADRRCLPTDTFVVASVPTLSREDSPRLAQFDPSEFDLVICDEAHHSIADSWKRVLAYFGFNEEGSKYDSLLVGVTATPGRGDKKGMGQVYDQISYQYSLQDAVRDDWLVMPRGYRVDTGDSLEGVSIKAGDFNTSELAGVVDNLRRNQLAVRSYEKYGEGLRAIMFCVDIEHAQHAAIEFNKNGIPAAAVWGTDPERDLKMQAHKNGELQVLTNCNVLTEGYDDPIVACVINGAPTESQLRVIQRFGRCLRLQFGVDNLVEARKTGMGNLKEYGIIIDLVDATSKHSLATLPSLFGLPAGLDLKGVDIVEAIDEFEEVSEKHPEIDFSTLRDLAQIEVHALQVDLFSTKVGEGLLAISPLNWYKTPDGAYILRLFETKEHLEVTKSLIGDWVASGTIKGSYFIKDGWKSHEDAIRFADTMVSSLGRGLITQLRRDGGIKKKKATPAQIDLLKRLTPPDMKASIPDQLNREEASRIIDKLIELKLKIKRK